MNYIFILPLWSLNQKKTTYNLRKLHKTKTCAKLCSYNIARIFQRCITHTHTHIHINYTLNAHTHTHTHVRWATTHGGEGLLSLAARLTPCGWLRLAKVFTLKPEFSNAKLLLVSLPISAACVIQDGFRWAAEFFFPGKIIWSFFGVELLLTQNRRCMFVILFNYNKPEPEVFNSKLSTLLYEVRLS